MEITKPTREGRQRKTPSPGTGGRFKNWLAFQKHKPGMGLSTPQRAAATLFLKISREVNSPENWFQLIRCCI